MSEAPSTRERRTRPGSVLAVSGTLALLLAATLAAQVLDLDLSITSWFYDPAAGFPLGRTQPWKFLYEYGTIPGLVLALAAILAWAGSFQFACLASWRSLAALTALTVILGAGVLVNGVLKPYWGRPRPAEISQFGGQWEYRGPLSPGIPGKGQSFPCGHCTMGFVFVSLGFAWRRNKKLAAAGVGLGVVLGGMLSAARIIQGAHFFTDCLWSGGVILVTAQVLYYWVLRIPGQEEEPHAPHFRRPVAAWVLVGVAVVATGAFLSRRPVYEVFRNQLCMRPQVTRLVVTLDREFASTRVRYAEGPGRVSVTARGFGFPGRKVWTGTEIRYQGDAMFYDYEAGSRGWFSELSWSLEAVLPLELKDRL
ncbi:MAG: phosphatase PAP2 family protein, partial [Proteobacteria bacterium]|nr:phosphatase PAP2 family protein [Pseudomonadota bacterium]